MKWWWLRHHQTNSEENCNCWCHIWLKSVCVPILLCVSHILISLTKLWHRIISLYMCLGGTHHAKVLESKSGCRMTNEPTICLPVTVKWVSKTQISDVLYYQNLSYWCHKSYRRSWECSIQSRLNDDRLAAFTHAFINKTLRPDLVHTIELVETSYAMSWKSKRWTSMWKTESVG
jgi:hypothetical protein